MPRDGQFADPLEIIDPLAWAGRSPPHREWMVNGLIPKGSVTMLSGDGGLGKSLLMLQLLTAAATGTAWLDQETMHCRALGIFCEDDHDEIWRRMECVVRHIDVGFSELEDLQFVSRVGRDNLLMVPVDRFGKSHKPTEFFKQIYDQARETGAQLIVLDSLHDLFGGNENSRPEARYFVNLLRRMALDIDGSIVLCAHPSMSGLASGDGTSGSTAWNNAVRSRLYLSRPKADAGERVDPDARVLQSKKANYGKSGFSLLLRWTNGVFVPDQLDYFVQRMERGAIERLILEETAAAWPKDLPLSNAPNAQRFLPKVLARKPGVKFRAGDIERAMNALLDAGRLVVDQRKDRSPRGLRPADQPPSGDGE